MSRSWPLLLVATLLLGGCDEASKERYRAQAEKRKRLASQKVLQERAVEHWNAVRWRKWEDAAVHLKRPVDQHAYLRLKTDPTISYPTVEYVEVEYVFVTGEELNLGEVRVSWRQVDKQVGVVEEQEATQSWYKEEGRWWLDPEETLLPTTELGPSAARSPE